MRTTTKTDKSKYKVSLDFFHNGWTLSFFDNKEEIPSWIRAMEEQHGRITKQDIKEL